MKKVILASLAVVLHITVSFSKSYHVAMTGNDTSIGTPASPYRSIQKAAEVMLPGDTCYIHAGTYYETVRPAGSGTVGNPIVFIGYQNDEVVVHGGKVITGWTKNKGNIYQVPAPDEVKDLFADRKYMLWARHPNMPYDPVKGFDMCRPTLGTANPPVGIDWTGVTVFQDPTKEGWRYEFTKQNNYVLLPDDIALGGWLMGVPGLIDSEGEWCWKDGILYFWPIGNKDPNNLLVEGKIRDCAFDLTDRNHIVLKKIAVYGATVNMKGSEHCTLDGCRILYVSSMFDYPTMHVTKDNASPMTTNLPGKGVLVGGSYNTIQNCEIAYSWGNCVSLLGSHHTVYNCHIYSASWQGGSFCAVLAMNGGGHIVRSNTIHDALSTVVNFTNKFSFNPTPLDPWYIEYNEIYNGGLGKADNGVVGCFMTNGNGSVISHNWIHDGFNGYNTTLHSTSGIYLDNYSSNFIIHHNVIWNMMYGAMATGIRPNNPAAGYEPNYHQIYNNTMYNCRKAINSPDNDWNGTIGRPYWRGTKVFNNILLQSVTFGPATIGNNYYGATPQFVDPENHDFRLKSGSVCINSGAVIPGITDGYTGLAPDIGAYEYGGESWKPGHVFATDPATMSLDALKVLPINIFPNPASGKLRLQISEQLEKLEIYNMSGILALLRLNPEQQVDISRLKNGMYLIKASAGGKNYTGKLIVVRPDK